MPLLRQVSVQDSNASRIQMEPLHYQWTPMRNKDPVIVEVELGYVNGDLLKLPHGKTLVAVGLKKI